MATLLHTFDAGSGIHSLAVTENSCAITGDRNGGITVWDIPNRKKLRSFQTGHKLFLSLTITQDGRKAISGGLRHLRIWELENGSLAQAIDTSADEVKELISAPQGMCLSGHKYGGILLWDIETGNRTGALEAVDIRVFSRIMADPDEVTAMALTPDGRLLIAGSSKGFLRVWDLQTRMCIHAIHGHLLDVSGIVLFADPPQGLSVSWDGTLKSWAFEKDLVPVELFQGKPMINALALLPGTKEAVWGTEDGDLCFWDQEKGLVREQMHAHTSSVNALSFWNDQCLLSASEDGTMKVWSL